MSETAVFALLLCCMSVILFLLMRADKHRAAARQWRIPEARLFLFAFLGGAAGGWLAMKIYRHKTKHALFRILFPLLTIVQLAALIFLALN